MVKHSGLGYTANKSNDHRDMRRYLFLSSIALLGACATNTASHVTSFANASRELTKTTFQTLYTVNATTIDRKLIEIATLPEAKVKVLRAEDFFKVRGLHQKGKSQVLLAIEALGNYVDSLALLSSAEYRDQIDASSEKLYGSLNKMSALHKELTQEDLGLDQKSLAGIAALFDAIGIAIIEEKKREAIKQIVLSSNPHINKLCQAISKNIGQDLDLVKINMDRVLREKVEAYKKVYTSQKLEERMKTLRSITLYSMAIDRLPQMFEDTKKATVKMQEAHNVLAEELANDQFTTARLAKTVGELRSFSDHIKTQYNNLLEE